MDKARGLPIAAYMGMLVALALASAFVAMLAIIMWLPPKPPDVMRADVVADQFKSGYDYMLANGRPRPRDGMQWQVRRDAPEAERVSPHMLHMRVILAHGLSLPKDQVRVAASNIVRNETFVFRVRDMEDMRRHAEEAAREIEGQNAGAPGEAASRDAEIQVTVQGRREARRARVEAAIEARREAIEAVRAAREARARVFTDSDEDVQAPPEPPLPPAPPMFAPAPAGVMLISGFQIGAQLPDGRWLVMRQGRNWAEFDWFLRAALVIAGALVVLSLLAVLFARRLTRPIRSFADAVQAVGVNPQSEPVREEGPRELRGAARAVNTMQARLRALIADRTKTLAAVAHDMRTPLMRLRLVAEHAPPEQRDRLAKEIDEVEALVASFIAFARDDPAEEARVRLDLSALLQSIADDHAEAGRSVSFQGEERLIVTGQSLGLKRLFNNLVDNALKYGNCARMRLSREVGRVIVDIEDDGPGVPADQRESVFEPFVRLENGESKSASGAGLGLPAARSIARAHGGDVTILDAESGARVRVMLPG